LGVNQPWQDPSALVNAPQLGETAAEGLEAGDTRIHSCIYRNGALWFTHSTFLPASGTITNSAVDWWQVNPSALTVTQFGRISDPAAKIWYYYPSLDVNANGDMLVGYSSSSATAYGGAQYALHLAGDAANTVETPVQFVNGLAGYYKTYGGGRNVGEIIPERLLTLLIIPSGLFRNGPIQAVTGVPRLPMYPIRVRPPAAFPQGKQRRVSAIREQPLTGRLSPGPPDIMSNTGS
jgi:hypothetical protein